MYTDDIRLMSRNILDYSHDDIRGMLNRAADYIDCVESTAKTRRAKLDDYERAISEIREKLNELTRFSLEHPIDEWPPYLTCEEQTLGYVLDMFEAQARNPIYRTDAP